MSQSATAQGGRRLRQLRQAAGLSLQELAGRVDDGEVRAESLPLLAQMVKVQTQPYAHEPWFAALLDRARAWPRCAELWAHVSDDVERVMTGQSIVPLAFRVPGIEKPLCFRIVLVYLWFDPRFQLVHLLPYGAATQRQTACWAEEDGEG